MASHAVLCRAVLRCPLSLSVLPFVQLQGGDPTGTGKGGESIYGPTFKARRCLVLGLLCCVPSVGFPGVMAPLLNHL